MSSNNSSKSSPLHVAWLSDPQTQAEFRRVEQQVVDLQTRAMNLSQCKPDDALTILREAKALRDALELLKS